MLKVTNLDDIDELTCEHVLFDGRPWSLWSDGTLLPLIRGGDGDDGGSGEDGGDGGSGDDGGDGGEGGGSARTLTQDQVDRIVAREKAKAERDSQKKFTDWLAGQKSDADKATLDEAARAKVEAEEAKTDAERIRDEARRERLDAKIERKLAAAGIDDKGLARAARLVNVDLDASDDDIATEIDALKEDMPRLFGATGDGESDDGKGGAPSGVTTGSKAGKGGDKNAKTALERGADRWRSKAKKTSTAA